MNKIDNPECIQNDFQYNIDVEKGTKKIKIVNDVDNKSNTHLLNTFNPLEDDAKKISFFRRVCFLICAELIFLFGMISIFAFSTKVKEFAHTSNGVLLYVLSFVAFIVMGIVSFILILCKVKRNQLSNILLLALFITILVFMFGMPSAYHNIEGPLIGVSITFFTLFILCALTYVTKSITNTCKLIFITLLILILLTGAFCLIGLAYSRPLQSVYSGLGSLIVLAAFYVDIAFALEKNHQGYTENSYLEAVVQVHMNLASFVLYALGSFK